MQKRIHRVLIICSNYDNYMLEEDGRVDEQIFNEYVSLNLRYPPTLSRQIMLKTPLKYCRMEISTLLSRCLA